MLKQQSSLEVLGAHLQTILASIMASLQSNLPAASQTGPASRASTSGSDPTGDAASEEALVKLVLRLTVQAPPGLHAYLRDVEPLLPLPALQPACRYLLFGLFMICVWPVLPYLAWCWALLLPELNYAQRLSFSTFHKVASLADSLLLFPLSAQG